jgi:hypothetical protein
VKLTKEDVYPLWLRTALNIRGDITMSSGGRQRISRALEAPLREVCEQCNNEWLNALEERFRSFMVLPLNGYGPLHLTPSFQLTVALWAAKTWLLLERALGYLRAQKPYLLQPPREAFRWMREHNEPPPTVQVWMGAISAHEAGKHVSLLSTRLVGAPPDPPRGIAGIFTIGDVLLQVYTPARIAGSKDTTIHQLGVTGQMAQILTQLWPIAAQEVVWPPPIVISPQDFESLWPSGGYLHAEPLPEEPPEE